MTVQREIPDGFPFGSIEAVVKSPGEIGVVVETVAEKSTSGGRTKCHE
jgi:hypothetical protein